MSINGLGGERLTGKLEECVVGFHLFTRFNYKSITASSFDSHISEDVLQDKLLA